MDSGSIAADIRMRRELNDTVSKRDAVRLSTKEDQAVRVGGLFGLEFGEHFDC